MQGQLYLTHDESNAMHKPNSALHPSLSDQLAPLPAILWLPTQAWWCWQLRHGQTCWMQRCSGLGVWTACCTAPCPTGWPGQQYWQPWLGSFLWSLEQRWPGLQTALKVCHEG